MVPASWHLQNRLAEAYVTIERPDLALKALEDSLQITEGHPIPSRAAFEMRRILENQKRLVFAPVKKPVHQRLGFFCTYSFFARRIKALNLSFDAKKSLNQGQGKSRPVWVRAKGFVKIPSKMGPTSYFDDVAGSIQMVVDSMGVGDQIALESADDPIRHGSGSTFVAVTIVPPVACVEPALLLTYHPMGPGAWDAGRCRIKAACMASLFRLEQPFDLLQCLV